ncbi:MAG: lipoyl synthase, partial [Acidimicrobiia bacterium]|nr:lipoyl synthase [Acidimicrobiia bacterium]
MPAVVDATAARAAQRGGTSGWDRADVAAPGGRRLVAAAPEPEHAAGTVPAAGDLRPRQSVTVPVAAVSRAPETPAGGGRKPSWIRVVARTGPEFRRISGVMRDLDLVTVCEEAGCPNIYECWEQGTATFMLGGERCTRA